MVRIYWNGAVFAATPIQSDPGGWLMRAEDWGLGHPKGALMLIPMEDIIDVDHLPTTSPQEATTVTSKLSALADMAKSIHSDINDRADTEMARLQAARKKAEDGMGKFTKFVDGISQGADDIDNTVNQLSNLAADLDK